MVRVLARPDADSLAVPSPPPCTVSRSGTTTRRITLPLAVRPTSGETFARRWYSPRPRGPAGERQSGPAARHPGIQPTRRRGHRDPRRSVVVPIVARLSREHQARARRIILGYPCSASGDAAISVGLGKSVVLHRDDLGALRESASRQKPGTAPRAPAASQA